MSKKENGIRKKTKKATAASSRAKVEYVPETRAARPFSDAELEGSVRVDARKILSPAERRAVSEFTAARTRGRPRKDRPKVNATLRMDADVLDALRATGPGWQARVNDMLRRWVEKR